MAWNVLALKNSVPMNWMAALHHDASLKRRCCRSVPSRSSSAAATVKNTEPTKNTMLSAPWPTSWTNPGNGPMRKQADPIAKPAAIQPSQSTRASGRGPAWSAWPITPPTLGPVVRLRVTQFG